MMPNLLFHCLKPTHRHVQPLPGCISLQTLQILCCQVLLDAAKRSPISNPHIIGQLPARGMGFLGEEKGPRENVNCQIVIAPSYRASCRMWLWESPIGSIGGRKSVDLLWRIEMSKFMWRCKAGTGKKTRQPRIKARKRVENFWSLTGHQTVWMNQTWKESLGDVR
jgi:hypothetical protein